MSHIFVTSNSNLIEGFDNLYGTALCLKFPLLNHIKISIYTLEDFKKSEFSNLITNIESQTYSCFIIKEKTDISSTIAGIVINSDLVNRLGLNIMEKYSAIAHEIGHLLFFFRSHHDESFEEFFADSVACEIGLKEHINSLLSKLISSGIYDYCTCNLFRIRQKFIGC